MEINEAAKAAMRDVSRIIVGSPGARSVVASMRIAKVQFPKFRGEVKRVSNSRLFQGGFQVKLTALVPALEFPSCTRPVDPITRGSRVER